MSLDDLIAQRKGSVAEVPAGEVAPQAAATDEPRGVAQVVTPSGLEIYYQAAPKRLYRVRHHPDQINHPLFSNYAGAFDWREVPSVSTVNDVLAKQLSWWGMKVGVAGALAVVEEGELGGPWPGLDSEIVDSVVKRIQAQDLDVNKVRDKAADRGTNVHTALETWADEGVMPDPKFFPEHERGYIEALVAFLNDAHPTALYSELMVGSAVHGFAGRFDLFANLDFSGEVVVKSYPKRQPKRETLSGTWLIDAKTKTQTKKSVTPYESHKIQLGGYEGGLAECGYPLPEHKGLLHLFADGRYELVETHAEFEDFLAVLGAYRAVERVKAQ